MTTLHRIRPGDRLSSIAEAYGVSTGAVLHANPTKARARTLGGAEVFASLSVGEDLAVPTAPGDLGWPWDSCAGFDVPARFMRNLMSPGCEPAFITDDAQALEVIDFKACASDAGPDALTADVPIIERDKWLDSYGSGNKSLQPVTTACVCPTPCWTGYSCNCATTGKAPFQGGSAGAIMAEPLPGSSPPAQTGAGAATGVPMPAHSACPTGRQYNASDGLCYGPDGSGLSPDCEEGFVYSSKTNGCLLPVEALSELGLAMPLPSGKVCPPGTIYATTTLGEDPQCYTVSGTQGGLLLKDGVALVSPTVSDALATATKATPWWYVAGAVAVVALGAGGIYLATRKGSR